MSKFIKMYTLNTCKLFVCQLYLNKAFCIFTRDGFCHVGQAGLELVISSDHLAMASQSAGIIGMPATLPSLELTF